MHNIWLPFRVPNSRLYYLNNFGEMMNELRINLIALALFVVAITFLRHAAEIPDAAYNTAFWLRVFLLFCAIAFTAYDAIAFKIYAQARNKRSPNSPDLVSPLRVVFLFLAELLMFTVNAWIIAIPLIALELPDSKFSSTSLYNLFLFIGSWHAVNLIWYGIDPSEFRDFIRHGLYLAINVSLFFFFRFLAAHGFPQQVGIEVFDFTIIMSHATVIGTIYLIQVRYYIASHAKLIISGNLSSLRGADVRHERNCESTHP